MLASLIPHDFLFQLTQAENADVVANCGHLWNLTTPLEPRRRPIAINMSHVARFAHAFPIAAMVSTLSRHLRWNNVVNLQQMHKDGITPAEYWTDLPRKAVLCGDTNTRDLCASILAQPKLPVENRISTGHFDPISNKIKVMTMKVSKGLQCPVVELPGVGHMPAAGEDEKEPARVFYVGATRATQRLVVTASINGALSKNLITVNI